MSTQLSYLKDLDILLVKSSGIYRLGAEIHTLKTIAQKLKEYQCHRFLHDHRGTQVIAHTLESYDRPQIYEQLFGDHGIKAALLFDELNEDLRFLETVCRNRGWYFKIFNRYDLAITWLTAS